jgi:hypothetical protein
VKRNASLAGTTDMGAKRLPSIPAGKAKLVNLDLKHSLLVAIYDTYDEASMPFPSACQRDCRVCCTQNVLATTLEVELILEDMERKSRYDLLEKMRDAEKRERLQPGLTVNSLAGYCLRREEPPYEDREFDTTACPLREESGCAIYHVRPFGCRSLWSEEICQPEAEAVMSPVLVSLNGVFQQILEHADAGGLYGNMIDLICALSEPTERTAYRAGHGLEPTAVLHTTQPNPGFLVLPQHRHAVMSALNSLWEKRAGNLQFREALELVRAGCKS